MRKYIPLKGGIPSVPTMSRMIASIDIDMLNYTFMAWVGSYADTRGRDIAVDGKGHKAGTRKIMDEKTPYILNAIDKQTGLVVGQMPIDGKTNEAGILPEFLRILQLEGSIVTIDAIGTTERIMDTLHEMKAHFVLQVKMNCPVLYEEIKNLIEDLNREKEQDAEEFHKKYEDVYSDYAPFVEQNRERYEYRRMTEYHDPEGIKAFKEERPYIECVGLSRQIRIKKIKDTDGNDITPGLKEFLEKGSSKQPLPKEGDGMSDSIQSVGIISDVILTAEEMAKIKRGHWSIENSLHHVLDVTMGEDGCTIKKGRVAAATLRKCAYNIARILQQGKYKALTLVVDVFDKIMNDLSLGLDLIFKPVAKII